MSSSIYARYIPPLKRISVANLQSDAPATSSFQNQLAIATPPAIERDASSTYARYLPQGKKQYPPVTAQEESISPPSISLPKSKRKFEDFKEETTDARTSKKQKKKHGIKSETAQLGDFNTRSLPIPARSDIDHGIDTQADYHIEGNSKLDAVQIRAESVSRGDILHEENDASAAKTKKKSKEKRSKRTGSVAQDVVRDSDKAQLDDEDDARHAKLLKKREKSMKKASKLVEGVQAIPTAEVPEEMIQDPEVDEIHSLVPLPQPDPIPEPPPQSITASLPPWLASPLKVHSTHTARFQDIGIRAEIASALQKKGFGEALAIQATVLPLVLPGNQQQPGDVLVSAATGSGKTLAYVLPMIEDISRIGHRGVQGLIVVPTRELVAQARQVCEICTSAFAKVDGYEFKPVVGTAVGNEALVVEQDALVGEELIFDPLQYNREVEAVDKAWKTPVGAMDDREMFPAQEFKPRLPGHVLRTFMKADIVICTPGRLVEHLKYTPGFSLAHLQWLIVDEADKLLDQTFQQWLDIVIGQITNSNRTIRDRVRKIILSATMTSDIGQLTSLKLYRPKLVILEGALTERIESSHQLSLPALLRESGVKVEDDAIKPLYLIELLRREKLVIGADVPISDSDSESSDTDSNPDSFGSEPNDDDGSTTSSDSSLDSDVDSDSSSPIISDRATKLPPKASSGKPSVLIFTKSNETAVRLGRLIALLCPSVASRIGTLTSTTPRQSRQRTITSFSSNKITILVASDLVSRGLDLPNLAHVINYDVPSSLTNYVHRIGRTARAGKAGHAWTLFTATEGGWFWREIARNEKVQRVEGSKVERVNIKKEIFDEERQKYEEALETLEKEANAR